MIFDPRNPNDGLIAFNQYFVAGYRDQDTDTLYLIDENKVLWKFDDDSAQPLSYTWKSRTSCSLSPFSAVTFHTSSVSVYGPFCPLLIFSAFIIYNFINSTL